MTNEKLQINLQEDARMNNIVRANYPHLEALMERVACNTLEDIRMNAVVQAKFPQFASHFQK